MRVVIPWKDRVGYLRICLATIREALRDFKDPVHITVYNNESSVEIPSIAIENCDIVNLPGDDCHHVFIDMFNHQFSQIDDDYIINIDSDCCVHPSFFHAAKKMIEDLPQLGHASLYSEGNHPEPTKKIKDIYHVRGHISMTASIISRAAWSAFKKPTKGEEIRFGCIDGAFSTFVHEQFNACYSTIRSYVEHIGAVGAYSNLRDDGSSSCHRARRFMWEP